MGQGYASPVPQTAIERMMAGAGSGLGEARKWMNQKSGMGLGDMFIGESPELLDDLSWGAPLWKGKGFGGRLDSRLGDLMLLPVPMGLTGKGAQMGLRGLTKQLANDAIPNRPIEDALSMKAEMLFDPKGINYTEIFEKTGHWIGPKEGNPMTGGAYAITR